MDRQRVNAPAPTETPGGPDMEDGSKVCSVEGCERTDRLKRGMCGKHYQNWRNNEAATPCSIDGCEKGAVARGWCQMHYWRWCTYGTPGEAAPRRRAHNTLCSVEGCPEMAHGRGWCRIHYRRWQTHGDPLVTLRAPNGDGCLQSGYRVFERNGEAIREHREVMEGMLGRSLRAFEYVHHKNGIRDDNQPDNLELWTHPHPSGQRPEDLVTWIVQYYPELVRAAIGGAD